jgi:DNA-binding PadR family transcriptional regulator
MSVRNGLLALLAEGSRHGYELRKELEERTGALWDLNVGQVYTTLARLERDGLVVETRRGAEGEGGGDETQEQRRYSLTEEGRRELDVWFHEPRRRRAPERDELVIKLALAATGGLVDLDEVIDAQRVATTEELQRYTRLKASSDPGDLARQFALDAVIAQIDGELRWLDRCQARHRELEARR